MTSPQATGPEHLHALTGIRGLAAWFVVLYHIRLSLTALLPDWSIAVLAKGYLAVDLFFMLSGFVLWYNYAGRFREHGLFFAGPFMWRRIARVWPLHAIVLLAMVAFAAVQVWIGRGNPAFPFAELPLHFLLVQNWGFTRLLAWNDPAWSISTELGAYVVFPLAVCAVRWHRVPAAAIVALGAALLLALYHIFAINGHDRLGQDIPRLGPARCFIEFALGNLLCLLWQRWRDFPHTAVLASFACAAAIASGVLLRLPETAFVPAALAAGLLALAFDRGRISRGLGGGFILYLGKISYSTYLAHFFAFILFKLLFVDTTMQIGWAGLAGFLALMFAVSAGLYHGVEKPAQRWLNRHPPRWPPRARLAAAD